MDTRGISLALILTTAFIGGATATDLPGQRITALRIAVTGETNLKTSFIESLIEAAKEEKVAIDLVARNDENLTYTFVIAQETTIGSAAAAVIVLDRAGDVAASVVRSGRLSGRGALNACAKEIVKKIVVLGR